MDVINKMSTPAAVLIGSLLISISILVSSGVIEIPNIKMKPKTIPTASTSPTASQAEKIIGLAKEVGLNEGDFKSCFEAKKSQDEINKDMADATAAKISGTPGFIIGKSDAGGTITGIKVPGAFPYETFKTIIDQLQANSTVEQVIKAQPTEYNMEQAQASVDDDPVLGNKNAPITMIEFSDYECPFCKRHFTQTLPSLKKDYIDKGILKLVYRDYIAVPAHNPAANDAALAANCAKELDGDGGYFKFHDLYFLRTKANGDGV